jgi:hypothetical protein
MLVIADARQGLRAEQNHRLSSVAKPGDLDKAKV